MRTPHFSDFAPLRLCVRLIFSKQRACLLSEKPFKGRPVAAVNRAGANGAVYGQYYWG